MKRIVLAAAITASALAAVVPAQAATNLPSMFDVNISLTTGCKIVTAPANVSFTYTFDQAGAASLDAPGASITLKCTKNLNYSMALDGTGSYVDDATLLSYTLSLPAPSAGTGADQSYSITGNMPANQAGACPASAASCSNATATNKTRTLTVTY